MKKIMELLQNMKAKNEKKDNKGFSLVELIIVIAIMAILVGIVGTQVLPYINKSRNAKDVQKLSALCTDGMTAYTSTIDQLEASKKYTITITMTSGDASTATIATTGGNNADKLTAAFEALNDVKTAGLGMESTEGKALTKVTIDCQNTNPMITVKAAGFTDIKSK